MVPVVMMVEGVHHGSRGPVLHLAEELGAFVEAWNGIPVTIDHPEQDGQNVSANSPEMIDARTVGRVFNAHMDGDKLKAEAWIDEEAIRQLSPNALGHIMNGHPLDVSVGMFSEEEDVQGEHNGENYDSISRNSRPDHLALLPDASGACSWEDGCGVRTNKEGGSKKPMKNEELFKTMKELGKEGYSVNLISNAEAGLRELITNIQMKLDAMDTDLKIHFLQEVYEDHFVYEVRSREGATQLYKRSYTVNEGVIEFAAEEPTEVRKQVTYVTLKEGGPKRTKFSNNNSKQEVNKMSDKLDKPCCEDVVDALIANEKTTYGSEDKEWLLSLGEDKVAKLVANATAEAEVVKPEEDVTKPEVNAEEAPKTVDEYIDTMPEELKDQMRSGLALHKAQKAKMVKTILANTEGIWSQEELTRMDTDQLTKIYRSTNVAEEVADYSLNGGSPPESNSGEAIEHLSFAGIELE